MNNFVQRAITGLSFAFIVTLAILYSPITFLIVFLLVDILGLIEFYRLSRSAGSSPQTQTGVFISIVMMMLFSWLVWNGSDLKYFFAVIPLLCLVFITELYRKSAQPFTNIAYTLAGIAYITLPLLSIIIVALGIDLGSDIPYNAGMVFGTIFILWSSDTGAYMLGSWLGKHRLFERISPKKSWEGFFGGALFSLIAGYLMWRFFESVGLYDWLIIALIVVITGTFGDLVESMFKRSLKVKDSGTFFPGHGGILDRFDGLFISAPFVMLYLLLFCSR